MFWGPFSPFGQMGNGMDATSGLSIVPGDTTDSLDTGGQQQQATLIIVLVLVMG